MSMKKMAVSRGSGLCSLAITVCLTAYMQQTEEQYPLSQLLISLEPVHWSQAIFLGSLYGPRAAPGGPGTGRMPKGSARTQGW